MANTVPPAPRGDKPSVLLLGGSENAVACARRFDRDDTTCVVVNRAGAAAMRSRGVIRRPLPDGDATEDYLGWLRAEAGDWPGAVVLPLNDRALTAVVHAYDELLRTHRPTPLDPAVALAMLDKRATLELADRAGVPAPRQWTPEQGVADLVDDLPYPVIVKPRRNYELIGRTGRKYLAAADAAELRDHLVTADELPSGYVVNEFVPGGDELLSSYYAIRTADGRVLMEFTKRVDRRYPPNQGGATFHELVHLPETVDAGRRFFDAIGLVGLGNVEFKLDQRDGELKLIECNHRLTAATALMQDNGIDVVGAVYEHACGRLRPQPGFEDASGTMWYPLRDLRSFRRSGDPLRGWVRRPWRSSFPYFRWDDPAPSLGLWWSGLLDRVPGFRARR